MAMNETDEIKKTENEALDLIRITRDQVKARLQQATEEAEDT
jgi:hypothetical protein